LQFLAISYDTLFLSQSNYVVLPTDNDSDTTNEIQNLSINYKSLSISKGNTVVVNYGPSFVNKVSLGNLTTSFQTIDLSLYVPINASAVILEVLFMGGDAIHCKKNSASDEVRISFGTGACSQFVVPIDIDRTFQARCLSNNIAIWVTGYY
jgi:hypothetical protein